MLRHKRLQQQVDQRQQNEANQQRYQQSGSNRLSKMQNNDSQANQQHEDEDDEDEEDRRWRETARMLADHQELPGLFGRGREQARRGFEEDRMSVVSGAQSAGGGCQSTLSGWNLRSSLRGKQKQQHGKERQQQQQQQQQQKEAAANGTASIGPRSILSGISSASNRKGGVRRGKSPASQTRIPLGPKSGQHFVTNSRRRRQASELILSTVEARRQLAEAQRLQVAASLLGSSSYLADKPPSSFIHSDEEADEGCDGGKRIAGIKSGSCSPADRMLAQNHRLLHARSASRSPSKSPSPPVSKLSRRRNVPRPSEVQRNRLLLAASNRPPLAKIDQNSSDLCSSNDDGTSSSEAGSRASSPAPSSSSSATDSSGSSRFTELVRAESLPRLLSMDHDESAKLQAILAENKEQRAKPSPVHTQQKQAPVHPAAVVAASELESTGRLRRGALRRDSIRKLRLDRFQVKQPGQTEAAPAAEQHDSPRSHLHLLNQSYQSASDSSSAGPTQQPPASKRLPPARRLDIEQNPFLNRHHFRSSTSSNASHLQLATQLANSRNNTTDPGKLPIRPLSPQPKPEDLVIRKHQKPAASPRSRASLHVQADQVGTSCPPALNRRRPVSSDRQPATSLRSREQRLSYPAQQQASTLRQPERFINIERPAADATIADNQVQQVEEMLRQIQPNQTISWRTTSSHQVSSRKESVEEMPLQRQVSKGATEVICAPASDLEARYRNNLVDSQLQGHHQVAAAADTGRVRNSISQPIEPRASSQDDHLTHTGLHKEPVTKAVGSIPKVIADKRKKEQETDQVRREILERWRIETERREMMLRVEEKIAPCKQQKPVAADKSSTENRVLSPRPTSISPPIAFADPQTSRTKVAPQQPMISTTLASQQRPTTGPPSRPVPGAHAKPSPNPRPPLQSAPTIEQDEFTKRVDQLRKMAAAARADSGSTEASGRLIGTQRVYPQSATRTNPHTSGNLSERLAPTKREPAVVAQLRTEQLKTCRAPSPLLLTRENSPPLATQFTPLTRWGLSQSSLVSVSQPDDKKALPTHSLAQSANQTQQVVDPAGPAAVKLVVKERSAPQLGYAFVEPHPSVQRAIPASATPRGATRAPLIGTSPALAPRPAAIPPAPPLLASSFQGGRSRSPLRLVNGSPRSPDFGNNPASSSNDDSAIASSVSSPSSLSLVNQNSHSNDLGQGRTLARTTELSLAGSRPFGLAMPSQGILRRQQQNSISSDCSDSPQEGAGLKQTPAELLEPQLPLESSFRSEARAFPDNPMLVKLSSGPVGSPPKRVHFNDRTSVRSFESLSSLASDTTAVPAELLRQRLGSPDSVGSGGSGSGMSRLSAESPDLRKGSGAAIYAIRGDPELEGVHHLEPPQQTARTESPKVCQTALLVSRPVAQQQQQRTAHPHVHSPVGSRILQPQNAVMQPAYLSTGAQNNRQQPPYPQKYPKTLNLPNQPGNHVADDDDDDEYALRLRQAATSRVFSAYAAPHLQVAPPVMLSQQHSHSLHQSQLNRRLVAESQLLNFQTEV